MTAICPAGHRSESADYCDVCGMPIGDAGHPGFGAATADVATAEASTAAAPPLPAPAQVATAGAEAALGDPPPPPAAFEFVAEVSVDPSWYEAQQSPDPLPPVGPPEVIGLRTRSVLVGRASPSRDIYPEIDCGADSGVSRRQAHLTSDGTRWWVEDLESANGTFAGPADGALPTEPIPLGLQQELGSDDKIYVGAWTRIAIRPATEDERSA